MKDMYRSLGVDSGKEAVRAAFSRIIRNDYPGAWVNIIKHPTIENYVMTSHMDGDGSKFLQRLLHYLVTGDSTVFRGMVDDGLIMNGADIGASGFVYGTWLVTDVINMALPEKIKNIIMVEVAIRLEEIAKIFADNGLKISYNLLGGEVADLPYQLRTASFDVSVAAMMESKFVIKGNVQPDDAIWGMRSDGKAAWELVENSGLMSNGSTMERAWTMSTKYNKLYPFLAERIVDYSKRSWYKRLFPAIWPLETRNFFKGRFEIGDRPVELNGMEISEASMSPTRLWPIFIRKLMDALIKRNLLQDLHGISVNTGGGATKIQHLGKNICYHKTMPTPSPIFKLVQKESGESWENMFKTFNNGVGLDLVFSWSEAFQEVLNQVSRDCQIGCVELGTCMEKINEDSPSVMLETEFGTFEY